MCPFAVLGLPRTATREEILHAWRRAIRGVHPDKSGTADDTAAKAINDAKDQALASLPSSSMETEDHSVEVHQHAAAWREAIGVRAFNDRGGAPSYPLEEELAWLRAMASTGVPRPAVAEEPPASYLAQRAREHLIR